MSRIARQTHWLTTLTIIVAVVTVFMGACSKRTALADSVQELVFHTLTGDQIAMADISGPMLINFWSTDCAICLHEMPEMARIYDDYRDNGFELVAVAMPYDAPNRVLELAEKQSLPFPVALDIKGEALSSFATVKGTPTSFLLDKEGKLVKRYVGAIRMDNLRKQLDKLLELG